jgi:hypothetical protein
MNREIKELKSYKKELKDYLQTIRTNMNICDKEVKKLYKQTKQELNYIERYIKQEMVNKAFQ